MKSILGFHKTIDLRLYALKYQTLGFQTIRSKSSKRWLQRQNSDRFVRKAASSNYRARSAFKLLEIEEKFSIFSKLKQNEATFKKQEDKSTSPLLEDAPLVIDCGASPGGWSQVAMELLRSSKLHKSSVSNLQESCNVISIDLSEMAPIEGVYIIQGDFMTTPVQDEIIQRMGNRKASIILSDMAPSFSGIHFTDHYRTHELCLSVLAFSQNFLRPGGTLVAKYLMGEHENEFRKTLKENFGMVEPFKPKSSRKESTEFFYVCTRFRPKLAKHEALDKND